MLSFLKYLKKERGLDYDLLMNDEARVVFELVDLGVIYEISPKKSGVFKLCKNVEMNYNKKEVTFEVFPNRYMGVFFDYDDVFEIESDNKKAPKNYCVAYSLNPGEKEVLDFGLGSKVRVKALAKGHNYSNEGVKVRLPNGEQEFFKMDCEPFITTGLIYLGKSKNTKAVDFNTPCEKFLEGKKGLCINDKVYYNIRDVKETSKVFSVTYNDRKYCIEEKGQNKLIGR